MSATTSAVLAADLQTYFARELLVNAKKDMVFKQFGNEEELPSNSSKTISFTQYAKLATVSAGNLTEGTTPSDTALSSSAITATVDQTGAYVTLTDIGELTVKHPVMTKTMELLSMQAGESIDLAIQAVVLAGTSVVYAASRASRVALTATDYLATLEVQKAIKTLRRNGAVPFEGGKYVMIVDPEVEQDLINDTKFVNAATYSNVRALFNGEIGEWFGVRVVRSNNISTVASTATVHQSLVVGKNAFATTDLQNLQFYVESEGGTSDPLHQRKTVGWKVAFKSVILNNNFMVRLESASQF